MTRATAGHAPGSRSASSRLEGGTEFCVGVSVPDDIARERIKAVLARAGLTVLAAAELDGLAATSIRRKGITPAVVVVTADGSAAQRATVRAIRQELRGARVVIVSPSQQVGGARDALSTGAEGVVTEEDLEVALAPTVTAVAAGQMSFPRSLRPHVERPVFSSREKQVLGMVVLGFSNGEIAGRLYLAESTVKSHLRSAFRKLGVRSRKEAAALILDSKAGLGTGILGISEDEQS